MMIPNEVQLSSVIPNEVQLSSITLCTDYLQFCWQSEHTITHLEEDMHSGISLSSLPFPNCSLREIPIM